jgi:hypothetical protein
MANQLQGLSLMTKPDHRSGHPFSTLTLSRALPKQLFGGKASTKLHGCFFVPFPLQPLLWSYWHDSFYFQYDKAYYFCRAFCQPLGARVAKIEKVKAVTC